MAELADANRLKALAETGLLDGEASPSLDRFARVARAALDVPVALVSLVDDHRQFFTSQCGLAEPWASRRETPLSHSFCQHVVRTEDALIVTDARTDPRVRDNLAVVDLSVIAYAGVPIRLDDTTVLGSFCAIDTAPKPWTARDLAILGDLAAAVSEEIRLRRVAHRALVQDAELRGIVAELERARDGAVRARKDTRSSMEIVQVGLSALADHVALQSSPETARMLRVLLRTVKEIAGPEALKG